MKNRGENTDSIPNDLVLEILLRLPAKSIRRFRSVSKQWGSMLSSPYFTELFMTRSLARPRILFAVEGDGECLFFSAAQPHNPYGKSSLVVALDSHMKLPGDISRYSFSYAAGLIHLRNMWIPTEEDDDAMRLICNPITGQYAILTELKSYIDYSFLGFDPIDKQFNIADTKGHDHHIYIMTLGSGKVKWRKIQCPLIHCLYGESICINGVLYYSAQQFDKMSGSWCDGIVSFDVRSEKFEFLDAQCLYGLYGIKLVNFKGKLGRIKLNDFPGKIFRNDPIKLCMWVLEDAEKQEWSKYDYTLPEHDEVVGYSNLDIVGVTNSTGEIVLMERNITCKRFYVFYFNPERNTLRNLEIHGDVMGYRSKLYAIVDYVEDLNFEYYEDKNIFCNIT